MPYYEHNLILNVVDRTKLRLSVFQFCSKRNFIYVIMDIILSFLL